MKDYCEKLVIVQGDQYPIPIVIRDTKTKEKLRAEDVLSISATLGKIHKTTQDGGIRYDQDSGDWTFQITQEETFDLPVGDAVILIRVKTKANNIFGEYTEEPCYIKKSTDRTVL